MTTPIGRTEQAVAFGQQFAQIKLQTAAHGTNLSRLQGRVDKVLEIRQTVFGRHFKQQFGVLVFPGEIRRHVVSRNRESKRPPLDVAFHHDIDVGFVDHVHFRLEVAVGKRLFDAGDQRMLVAQIFRAYPVKGKVGKRRLRSPAGRNVQVVNQFLKGLFNLFIAQIVRPDVGRQVGVDRRKSLCAGPLVLQRAHKIDHLADSCRQVFGRAGLGFAGNAVETFVQ